MQKRSYEANKEKILAQQARYREEARNDPDPRKYMRKISLGTISRRKKQIAALETQLQEMYGTP